MAIITLVNAGFSWSSSHQASQSCLLVFASHSCVPQTAPSKTTVSTILSAQLFSFATLLLVPTTGPPFPPFLSRPSLLEALSSGTIHDLPPGRYTGHRCGAGTRQHKEIQGDYRASFSFLPSPIYHVLTWILHSCGHCSQELMLCPQPSSGTLSPANPQARQT